MGVKFNKQNYFKEKKKEKKKQLQKLNSCDPDGMENFPFGNHNYYFKNPNYSGIFGKCGHRLHNV